MNYGIILSTEIYEVGFLCIIRPTINVVMTC